jgi:hypothetical protein
MITLAFFGFSRSSAPGLVAFTGSLTTEELGGGANVTDLPAAVEVDGLLDIWLGDLEALKSGVLGSTGGEDRCPELCSMRSGKVDFLVFGFLAGGDGRGIGGAEVLAGESTGLGERRSRRVLVGTVTLLVPVNLLFDFGLFSNFALLLEEFGTAEGTDNSGRS